MCSDSFRLTWNCGGNCSPPTGRPSEEDLCTKEEEQTTWESKSAETFSLPTGFQYTEVLNKNTYCQTTAGFHVLAHLSLHTITFQKHVEIQIRIIWGLMQQSEMVVEGSKLVSKYKAVCSDGWLASNGPQKYLEVDFRVVIFSHQLN